MKMTCGELRYFAAYVRWLARERAWLPQASDYGVYGRYRPGEIRRHAERVMRQVVRDPSRLRRTVTGGPRV